MSHHKCRWKTIFMVESAASNRMTHSSDWSVACEKYRVFQKMSEYGKAVQWEALGQASVCCCNTNIVNEVLSRDLCPPIFNNLLPHLQNRWNQPVEQIKTIFLAHQETVVTSRTILQLPSPNSWGKGEKDTTRCCVTAHEQLGAVTALGKGASKAPALCWQPGSGQPKRNGRALRFIASSEQTQSHRRQSPEKKEKVDRTWPCCSRPLHNNISWQSCWNTATALETFLNTQSIL